MEKRNKKKKIGKKDEQETLWPDKSPKFSMWHSSTRSDDFSRPNKDDATGGVLASHIGSTQVGLHRIASSPKGLLQTGNYEIQSSLRRTASRNANILTKLHTAK